MDTKKVQNYIYSGNGWRLCRSCEPFARECGRVQRRTGMCYLSNQSAYDIDMNPVSAKEPGVRRPL